MSKGFVKRKDGRVVEVTVPKDDPNIEALTPEEHRERHRHCWPPEDDLLDLRLSLRRPAGSANSTVQHLRASLHDAGKCDTPAGRLAGNELLRLIEDAVELERRIKALREAVGR